jgi:hypothetical protein
LFANKANCELGKPCDQTLLPGLPEWAISHCVYQPVCPLDTTEPPPGLKRVLFKIRESVPHFTIRYKNVSKAWFNIKLDKVNFK